MEDLLAFLDELEQDEELKKAFLKAKDFDDVCRLAKSYGYYFTVDELEEYYMQQVSGGGSVVNKESLTGIIEQNINGDNNIVLSCGDVTVTKGCVEETQKAEIDKMAVLGELRKLGVFDKRY